MLKRNKIMVKAPIWKDTYYTTNADSLTYRLVDDKGVVIFTGRAYKYPNADVLKVNINKICRNYLSNDIQDFLEDSSVGFFNNAEACKEFSLLDTEGNTLEEYVFLYDYDYDHNWQGEATSLSMPINGKYIDGMLCLSTAVSAAGIVTNSKVNNSYNYRLGGCVDYVLYYLNARGGWDSFCIEGATTKSDKITQYTTDKVYDNTSLDFENNRYVSEIQTQYVMNTGLLSDEQSEILAKHLLASNKVYIHSIKDMKIIPAVITDTNVTYQTYKTNGKKMAQYKINIKESQTKIRR